MTTGHRAAVLSAALTLALGACSGDDEDDASLCEASMIIAMQEDDPSRADPLIRDTLSDCDSAEQWLDTLRKYPGAMGLTGPEFVSVLDLQVACADPAVHDTPVCADAIGQGIVTG